MNFKDVNNENEKFIFRADGSAMNENVPQNSKVPNAPEENKKVSPVSSLHIVFAALLLVLLFHLFLRVGIVNGNSMRDTLNNGQIVLVSKLSSIETGDVVMTTANNRLGRRLIKRVIATEGQHLYIKGGAVFIDGERLDETYVYETEWGMGGELNILLPQGSVFLMGDNRNNSEDSRTLGLFSTKEIVGELLFIE